MKLSVILVSVNLAASLPLMTATGVCAQEAAQTGTGQWLKSSLSSLDSSVNQKKGARSHKASLSQPTADASGPVALHANGIRLRPFVPNRKLPSQHDLDLQFIAQTARMAQPSDPPPLLPQTPSMAPAPLNGSISQSSLQTGIQSYSTGYIRQSSSRVVPAQVVATPGQVRRLQSNKRQRFAVPPTMQAQDELENDSPNDQIAPSQFVGSSYQQRQMAGTMQQPAAQMQMAPPQSAQLPKQFAPISPDEQAIMDRMVNSVHTNLIDRGSGSDQSGSFQSNSAGPPPFPLNLLPQDSLKQVIGGSMRRSRIETQPSYFGSWHNNSNLPSGGFHSYAPRMSHLPEPAPKTAYHRASQSRPTVGASRASSSQSSSSLAELRRLPPHEARVETYPPYLRLSSVSGY